MDLSRGILGAVMGGASGLQAGKKQEFETEKEVTLEMMKALRAENLARFQHGLDLDKAKAKHGYDLELKEKDNEYAVAREGAKPKSAPTTRNVNKGSEQITQEWDGEKWVDVSKAPRWNPKEGAGGDGSGGGNPAGLNPLEASRIIDMGKAIQGDYTKKNKEVPEWMLNDWNAARESVGLPTVSQDKVKGYFRDKWKLDLDRLTSGNEGSSGNGGSPGILGDVIKQVQEDQAKATQAGAPEQKPDEKPGGQRKTLNIADVIASVKGGQRGMPQAGAAEVAKQEPEQQQPEQKANAWSGHVERQAETQRMRQVDQLIDESAKAKNDQAGKPYERSEARSRSVRERRERLAKIRQLMNEGKK